ncbi:hypothetical protein BD289DRAFT_221767 [Coniella lustricola]|uniref:Uncharacterized protein n=1 Tax=Coniella lustricola TaxID=2025994 RepID=A0A2T3AB31_9PEZI|nr:hypothetical protein BD289DRAFT_221767 [Coniella lustricola]
MVYHMSRCYRVDQRSRPGRPRSPQQLAWEAMVSRDSLRTWLVSGPRRLSVCGSTLPGLERQFGRSSEKYEKYIKSFMERFFRIWILDTPTPGELLISVLITSFVLLFLCFVSTSRVAGHLTTRRFPFLVSVFCHNLPYCFLLLPHSNQVPHYLISK